MAQVDSDLGSAWISGPFWAIILCAVAALAVLFSLGRALLSPLRKVPGPFAARFTDLWYLCKLYRGDFEAENLYLHNKYGKNDLKQHHQDPVHDLLIVLQVPLFDWVQTATRSLIQMP